jgi:uncharacterized protein YggE
MGPTSGQIRKNKPMRNMRKPALAIAALVALGSTLLTGASANASTSPTRYISLSSTGTVKVTPDAVRMSATVTVLLPTSKAAMAATSTAAGAVRSALLANGIAAKYLKSTSITIAPEYNYTQDKGQILTGYRASQSFEVIIVNAKSAGAVVDAAVAAGGDPLVLNGVTPFVLDNTGAAEAARVVAVKLARSHAATYAKLLGVKLGKVIYMEETGAPVMYPPTYSPISKQDVGVPTQVDLGQQDVSVSINIRWYII